MKKIFFILSIAVLAESFSFFIQAQDVSMFIKKNSFKICDNMLFFTIHLKNNSKQTYIFWNLNLPYYDISEHTMINKKYLKYDESNFSVNITNLNGKYISLPNKSDGKTNYIQPSLPKIMCYAVLKPNDYLDYKMQYDVAGINVKGRSYLFDLKYFGNNYYSHKLNKLKAIGKIPKSTQNFVGVIRSEKHVISYLLPL